jgi:hypothetical protein
MTVMMTDAAGEDHGGDDRRLNASTNSVLTTMTMQPPCVPKKVAARSTTQRPWSTMTKATKITIEGNDNDSDCFSNNIRPPC